MMKTANRIRFAGAIALASTLVLTPPDCAADATPLLASNIFSTDAGETAGLAYDAATNQLYTVERRTNTAEPQLRAYTLDGTLIPGGPHELLETAGGGTKMGLHVLRGGTSIGGQAVPAGTLTYLRGAIATFPNVTLYALDKADGTVLTSEVVNPDFDTGGLCESPLVSGGKGLGYSTHLGRFMSTHSLNNCSGFALFTGGQVTGFIPVPLPGSGGAGDVKEHPLSGNLWVANAPDADSLTVFSQAGAPLQEFDVVDADTLSAVGSVMRIAFDATGDRLWLIRTGGDVYQIDAPAVSTPVPTVHPLASIFLALILIGLALQRARPETPRSA
jgi:hypothetical protein